MIYIKLDEGMNLVMTQYEPIYRGDHLNQKITYLIPLTVGEIDMLSAAVYLSYVRADGTADIALLTREEETYNDRYYQYHLPVTSTLSRYAGEICTFLQIFSGPPRHPVVAKSGECVLRVIDSKNMDEYITDRNLWLVYEMQRYMENKIERAENTLSERLDKAEDAIALKADNLVFHKEDSTIQLVSTVTVTGTIIVTRSGSGAVSATSSDTGVATVSVSGTTVIVTGKVSGGATVTVNVAGDGNYTAPISQTCAVEVSMYSPTLGNNTPAQIQAAAKEGLAPSLWSVGDKIGISLNGKVGALTLNGTYYAVILGFNHNSSIEGGNSIHFQFGKTSAGVDIAFCDAGYGEYYQGNASARFAMNTSYPNSGGWNNSYMRKTICPAFLSAMPTAWQNAIAACTKYSDNTGGGSDTASYVTATSDKIWLLSEFEVHGSRSYANSVEKNYQKQYDYYKNGNGNVRHQHSNTDSLCVWWLRSACTGSTYNFCGVRTVDSWTGYAASASQGFAPGFMVA